METITIKVLDLKVKEVLQKMEEDNLISIEKREPIDTNDIKKKVDNDYYGLSNVVPPITMDEIVKEVKIVRQKMYEAKQNSDR